MFAVVLGGEPDVRDLDDLVILAVEPADAFIAVTNEVVAVEVHAVGAALGKVGEQGGAIGDAFLVFVQDLDVALAGDDDAPLRINRQRVDIGRHGVVGIERDLEARRHLEAEVLRGFAAKTWRDEKYATEK